MRSAARRCREGEAGSSGILEPGREGFEEPTVTLFLLHEEGRSPCQGLHGDLGFSDGSFPGRRVWLPTVSAAKASRDDWIGSQSEQQNQREPWGLRFHIPAPATTIRFFCWMSHGTKKTKGLKAMTEQPAGATEKPSLPSPAPRGPACSRSCFLALTSTWPLETVLERTRVRAQLPKPMPSLCPYYL